jgi:hypothetical protein
VNEVVLAERLALVGLGTVDSGGRREHEVLDAVLLQSDQEVDKTADVVLVVSEGTLDRFGNRLESSEVNDASDAGPGGGVSREELAHLSAPVVHLVESEGRHDEAVLDTVLFGEDPDGPEDFLEAVAQIVDNDDVVAVLEKLKGCVRSNVTEASKDHNVVLPIVRGKDAVGEVLIERALENLRGTRAGRCRALKRERCRRGRRTNGVRHCEGRLSNGEC